MATVFKGIGTQIARDPEIDLGPELDAIAEEIEAYAVGLAAEHVQTGDYALSLKVVIDRASPSGRDRYVISDDDIAFSLEYGHDIVRNGKVVGHADGLHILGRAADAVQPR